MLVCIAFGGGKCYLAVVQPDENDSMRTVLSMLCLLAATLCYGQTGPARFRSFNVLPKDDQTYSISFAVDSADSVAFYYVEESANRLCWNNYVVVDAASSPSYGVYSANLHVPVVSVGLLPLLCVAVPRRRKLVAVGVLAVCLVACSKEAVAPAKAPRYFRVVAVNFDGSTAAVTRVYSL